MDKFNVLLNKLNLVNNNSKYFFQLIWCNPLIFFTQNNYFRDYFIKNNNIYIPNIVKNNKENIIISSSANWYWNDNKYRIDQHKLTVNGIELFLKNYPKTRIILMHSDETFIDGYPKYLEFINFNRNALLDTDSFSIVNKEKKYDSIYNSNFYKYKQHYLLENINDYKIALIYYHRSSNFNQAYYINNNDIAEGYKIENNFLLKNNFELLNRIGGNYTFLNKQQINDYYNESYSGLCLSDIEGACLVSVEYLLSGLPVISVKNFGGRNKFLKQMGEFCLRNLNYDTNEIQEAIKYFKNKNFNKKDIRNKILKIINKEWNNLFIELDKLKIDIKDKGCFKKTFSKSWNEYKL